MSRFFNERIMHRKGLIGNLEKERKEFNKEQREQDSYRQEADTEGSIHTEEGEQEKSEPADPLVRNGVKRTGRNHKSRTGKARRNRRKGNSRSNRKGGERLRGTTESHGDEGGTAETAELDTAGSQIDASWVQEVESRQISYSK